MDTPDPKQTQALLKLAIFGHLVLRAHRDPEPGDVDGATLQDLAVKAGVVTPVQANEACGPNCGCAELGLLPTQCYFDGPDVAAVRGRLQALLDRGLHKPLVSSGMEEALRQIGQAS